MIKKHWCLPFKWGWNCILSSCPLTAVSSSLKIFSHLSTVFGSLPATGYWQHASYCYVSQQCDVTSLLVHTERMPRALWNVKSLTHVCVMEINLCGLCAAVCSLSISPAACDALCLDFGKITHVSALTPERLVALWQRELRASTQVQPSFFLACCKQGLCVCVRDQEDLSTHFGRRCSFNGSLIDYSHFYWEIITSTFIVTSYGGLTAAFCCKAASIYERRKF